MHLRQLPAASNVERSADEQLAGEITAYFLGQAAFPKRHGFALVHDAPPPTVYGRAWRLEWGEDWCAHALGTVYYDVSPSGEFSTENSVVGHVMALIASPSTSARPGTVWSSHARHVRHRDGVSPGSNAMGRLGSVMGRVGGAAPEGAP